MRASLRDDLTAAIKARDRVAITALRSALAAIDNAEAVPVDHRADGVTGGQRRGERTRRGSGDRCGSGRGAASSAHRR
ncbi:hypothetical protein GCM10023317_82610 [Actinopolymorpha pittospori]